MGESSKLALLIGINDYPLVGNLKYAEADATAFAESLKANYGFADDEIVLMKPGLPGGLTPTQTFIERRFKAIRESNRDLSLFVVGFWGHGFLLPGGERFLCGTDAVADDLRRTGVSVESILSTVGQTGAATSVLILDCCQNAPGKSVDSAATAFSEEEAEATARTVSQTARDAAAKRRNRDVYSAPPTVAILNSCSPGEKAFEWDAKRHGAFTALLLDAMNARLETVGGWADYVSRRFGETAALLGGNQRPFFKLEGGGVARLLPEGAGGSSGSTGAFPPPPPKPSVAERRWRTFDAKSQAERTLTESALKTAIRAGEVVRGTYLWTEGRADWSLVETLPEFAGLFPPPRPIFSAPSKPKPTADDRVGSRAGERREIAIKGARYGFCWAPPGEFEMGSPTSEEGHSDRETQHTVKLPRGFWIGETEVTQGLWKAVMGTSVEDQAKKNIFFNSLYGVGSDYPMYYVSWEDCREFIDKLNGLGAAPSGCEFRLPTEAEWEYACRAGTSGPYNGSDLSSLGWYFGNSGSGTHPVGRKTANAWGLYDTHGNVCEWCSDWYDSDYYETSPTEAPTGPTSASARVIRGGSWSSDAGSCRSAYRLHGKPSNRYDLVGLRLVLSSSK